jgi:hypothetical protein
LIFEDKKMNNLQTVKTVQITPPQAIVDNAAFTTATVDTRGFSKARVLVSLGALDIALTVFKLRQGDASNMSDATDVSGADFSVSPLTLPSATADNTLYSIYVDLRGKKRYLDLSLTGGDGATGTFATVTVDLYGAAEAPNSAAERGNAQEAFV